MKKKTSKPAPLPFCHLYKVGVRHRDYFPTVNDHSHTLHMTHTNLWITVHDKSERADMKRGFNKVVAFLNRHRRDYGISTILSIEYCGSIDA